MTSGSTIIEVRDLTVGYGTRVILRDVSFEVQRGEILFILGGSGSGKSTLLKHMIGLYEPTSGQVTIDGIDLVGADQEHRRQILRKIGVAYQSGALFGSMTLGDNIRLPLEAFTRLPPSAMTEIAQRKLGLVGLHDGLDLMPNELSGGMIKRAAIARAMALDPAILFLDEPSAGLDPVTSAELDDLIRGLARDLNITFVVVSHELASIFAISDRVIMVDKLTHGIIADGRASDLRDHSDLPAVQQFFNREPGTYDREPGMQRP